MKYFLLIFPLFVSCSILYPKGPRLKKPTYNHEYKTFVKKLDFKKGAYLLAPTSFYKSNRTENIDGIYDFFKSKLGDRLMLTDDLRDESGKKIILVRVDYDTALDHIDFFSKISDYQYLILTKITYLKDDRRLEANKYYSKTKPLNSETRTGAKSSILVLDLENKSVFLELDFSGYVSISDKEDDGVANIYSGSYSLGRKTMKKLLKKIK